MTERPVSNGMAVLRSTVLGADGLSLLAVLSIRFLLPIISSGQEGEALFWTGLLLTYLLILLLGLTLVLNLIYLLALGITRGRYNRYGRLTRPLLVLLPAATVLGLAVH